MISSAVPDRAMGPTPVHGALAVRPITASAHLAFTDARAATDAVSFLQCPAWGRVKPAWESESVGWFDGPGLAGAATVLYRRLPGTGRCLAYVPEGPAIDWFGEHGPRRLLGAWLDPLVRHARRRGAFAVRVGPPVVAQAWENGTLRAGMADPAVPSLAELPPDRRDPRAEDLTRRLAALGWRHVEGDDGAQPRYRVHLPLDGRDEDGVWSGFSPQWRRNVRAAERAGVRIACEDASALPEFQRLYLATAVRDGFTPRPFPYFARLLRSLEAESPERVRLYLARRDGVPLAAAILVRVGSFAWYSYGASADRGREVRPSNALQWRMIRDCLAAGVRRYDLRGVAGTLDLCARLSGMLRFKLGSGCEGVEYLGEWDLPLNRALYRIFRLRAARR